MINPAITDRSEEDTESKVGYQEVYFSRSVVSFKRATPSTYMLAQM